jgi:hypothetical protein
MLLYLARIAGVSFSIRPLSGRHVCLCLAAGTYQRIQPRTNTSCTHPHIPERTRTYWHVPPRTGTRTGHTGTFRHVPARHVPARTRMYRHVPVRTGTYRDFLACTGRYGCVMGNGHVFRLCLETCLFAGQQRAYFYLFNLRKDVGLALCLRAAAAFLCHLLQHACCAISASWFYVRQCACMPTASSLFLFFPAACLFEFPKRAIWFGIVRASSCRVPVSLATAFVLPSCSILVLCSAMCSHAMCSCLFLQRACLISCSVPCFCIWHCACEPLQHACFSCCTFVFPSCSVFVCSVLVQSAVWSYSVCLCSSP